MNDRRVDWILIAILALVLVSRLQGPATTAPAVSAYDTAVPVRETSDLEPWLTDLLVEARPVFESAGYTFSPLDPHQVDENGQPPARWAKYLALVPAGSPPTLVVGTGLEAKKTVPITEGMTPEQLLEAAQ